MSRTLPGHSARPWLAGVSWSLGAQSKEGPRKVSYSSVCAMREARGGEGAWRGPQEQLQMQGGGDPREADASAGEGCPTATASGPWVPNTAQGKGQASGRQVEYVQVIPRGRNKGGREGKRLCWRSQTQFGRGGGWGRWGGGQVTNSFPKRKRQRTVDRNVWGWGRQGGQEG